MGEYGDWQEGRNHTRTTGWYGGISGWAFNASVFPAEGLTVNLSIPFANSQAAGFTYSRIEAQVQYRIVDIGNVTLSFQSNTGWLERDEVLDGNRKTDPQTPLGADGKPDPDYKYDAPPASWWVTDQTGTPKIWASFYLTAVDNIGVDLGLAYKFPLSYNYDIRATEDKLGRAIDAYTYEYNQNFPIEIGLGFRFVSGDFTFKLRGAVSLAGSTESTSAPNYDKDGNAVKATNATVNDPFQLSVNILPSLKIKTITAYLYAGMSLQSIEDWKDPKAGSIFKNSGSNDVLGWFINPYVLIPAGSIRFLAGFQLWSDGVGYPYYQKGEQKFDPAKVSWAVPIGFYTYF